VPSLFLHELNNFTFHVQTPNGQDLNTSIDPNTNNQAGALFVWRECVSAINRAEFKSISPLLKSMPSLKPVPSSVLVSALLHAMTPKTVISFASLS